MKTLYQIRKIKQAGNFRGRDRLVEGNFESIKAAGQYLIENYLELFSPNTALNNDMTALIDPTGVIFELGQTDIQDGDDLFEISSQNISPID